MGELPSNQSLAETCVSEVRALAPHLAGRYPNQTITWESARSGQRSDGLWVVVVDRIDSTPGLSSSAGAYLALLDWGSEDRLISGGEVNAVSPEQFSELINGGGFFGGGGETS